MNEKSQLIRQHIVDKANHLFYTKGYNQTSLADIAALVDITKGNLHYHFRSKEDLLDAVIAYRKAGIQSQLAQWRQQFPNAKDQLRRFVKMLSNEKNNLIRYGCPMGSLNVELGKYQLDLKLKAVEMFDLFQAWLEQAMRKIKGKNAKSLSLHLLSMAQGAVLMGYIYDNPKLLDDEIKNMLAWIETL